MRIRLKISQTCFKRLCFLTSTIKQLLQYIMSQRASIVEIEAKVIFLLKDERSLKKSLVAQNIRR
jgi:hypothetical protein